jgi:leucine dehydrogenase
MASFRRRLALADATERARRHADFDGHEEVWEATDPESGLHAFIAVHDTALGPALGGCRMWPYASPEAALGDALRLSRGMTYKAALAGLDFGGGKAVIVGDPKRDKSEARLRAFGAAVEALGGRYVTAEDVGTGVADMDLIALETEHVVGTTARGEDPSFMTALGVAEGIKAALRHRLGAESLAGVTVAVQGLGHVGAALCERLAQAGARLVVADVDGARAERAARGLGARGVAPDGIFDEPADAFAPCALGAVLDDATIPRLRAAVVAGSANNQLARERHGYALKERGILYAPDYAINAGGLISASMSLLGEDPRGAGAWAKTCQIGPTLSEIFRRADADGLPPHAVADRLARERIRRRRAA